MADSFETGMEQGEEQGLLKGIEQGIEQEKIFIVRNALKMGLSSPDISKLTGLSEQEIETIR